MNLNKVIYFDNAATTKVKRGTVNVMEDYFLKKYGNPSSAYEFGRIANEEMEKGRELIAKLLHCLPEEIYFTSGGTESDNWALKGIAFRRLKSGCHIITSKIEHPAIYKTCEYLKGLGADITYLDVDQTGMISLSELRRAIRKNTVLISIMTANNEIGTIQPIYEIGKIAAANHILFHTDAVQAFGHIPLDVNKCSLSMLSASSHKFGGPKGVGFLYIRKGVEIDSFLHGGEQENGMRAGTGNVPGVAGMCEAAKYRLENMENSMRYETMLRNYMIKRILQEIPYTRLNGHPTNRLPGNMNLSFQYVDGGTLLEMLDTEGICVSTGSACSSKSKELSRTLKAIGLEDDMIHSAVRFTLSDDNTREEIDHSIEMMKEFVSQIRGKSSKYREKSVEFNGRF